LKKAIGLFLLVLLNSALALAAVEERLVTQPLDHEKAEGDTLRQRVQLLRASEADANTPILVFLDGEGPGANVENLAKPYLGFAALKPLHFAAVEHRGYGKSISNDADQTVPAYVSADQAIHDFHAVLVSLRQEFSGPIITMGYSYAGGLVVRHAKLFPEDTDLVISSSGVVSWPLSFSGHEDAIRDWPSDLHANLAKHAANLYAQEPRNLKDLEFLQMGLMGLSQYERFQTSIGKLKMIIGLETSTFMKALRSFDSMAAGGAIEEMAGPRVKTKLTREEAISGKAYGRYWGYQQCFEMGTFVIGTDTAKIFIQSEQDIGNWCESMYGIRPTFTKRHDWTEDAAQLSVPLLYIAGGKDPWRTLGLQSTSRFATGGKYIFVETGFHGPDRDNEKLATEVMQAAFELLQK